VSDPKKKPVKLKKGETLVYSSDGAYIHLKKGEKIEIISEGLTLIANDSLTVKSPKVIFEGEVEVAKDLKAGGVSLVNHKHFVPNGMSENPIPEA
ncbi:MAG: hypothetical protein D3907_11395, partial [Candidatus Electrothrix sp. AUS3]|nr:hypothetical protein [Candidatus Electrothrix gigas]